MSSSSESSSAVAAEPQVDPQAAAVAEMAAMKAAGKPIVGIVLWSGGLDSMLAQHILRKACPGIKLLTFTVCSPFWKTKHHSDIMVDIEDSYYDVLRNPAHGRGRAYNPCTDCHTYMLQRAREMMKEVGACFIATGEVLGQRPMSQMSEKLPVVEHGAGLDGLLVRPLSAKLLPPTIPEKAGILDRNMLEDISGRSRKRQMELVQQFGIEKFPSPGGGCWLTTVEMGAKIRTIVEGRAHVDKRMFQLLPHARFFSQDGVFIFIGRNGEDNAFLRQFVEQSPADAGYRIVQGDQIGVPLVMIQAADGVVPPAVADYIKQLLVKYSKKKDQTPSEVPAAAEAAPVASA